LGGSFLRLETMHCCIVSLQVPTPTPRLGVKVRLLVNPAAGRGRAARLLPEVQAAFAHVGVRDVRLTASAGDEQRLVEEALHDGCTTIAVLGGDGTWSKVAAALAAADGSCRLALLNGGTGNDFTKSLPIPATDARAMAALAVDGPDRRVDMGRIDGKLFLNVAGFGFDAAVLDAMAAAPWLGGEIGYAGAALRQLFGYPGVEIDADATGARRTLLFAIANGRSFGGAFRIAPHADVGDGLLDAIAIADASPLRRLPLFAAAMRGAHLALAGVMERRARRFTLAFGAPPLYQADGELRRASSAVVDAECVPGAIRVVTRDDGSALPRS
jgi:YegS/Rv2252/BmrU family lipid kinase